MIEHADELNGLIAPLQEKKEKTSDIDRTTFKKIFFSLRSLIYKAEAVRAIATQVIPYAPTERYAPGEPDEIEPGLELTNDGGE